jgi:hypothetical protein
MAKGSGSLTLAVVQCSRQFFYLLFAGEIFGKKCYNTHSFLIVILRSEATKNLEEKYPVRDSSARRGPQNDR